MKTIIIFIITLLGVSNLSAQTNVKIKAKIDSLESLKVKIEKIVNRMNNEIQLLKQTMQQGGNEIPELKETSVKKGSSFFSGGFIYPASPRSFKDAQKLGMAGDFSIYRNIYGFFGLGGEFFYGQTSPDMKGLLIKMGTTTFLSHHHVYRTLKGGTVSILSASPSLVLKAHLHSHIILNVIGGAGYYRILSAKGTISAPSEGEKVNFPSSIENKVGGHIGILLDFPLNDSMKLALKLKYHVVSTDLKTSQFLTTYFGVGFPF